MGVYIKGMTAQQARMWLNYHMPFTFIVTDDDITEVTEPHGRLIDADVLYQKVRTDESEDAYVRYLLRHEPTVIEAEGDS